MPMDCSHWRGDCGHHLVDKPVHCPSCEKDFFRVTCTQDCGFKPVIKCFYCFADIDLTQATTEAE